MAPTKTGKCRLGLKCRLIDDVAACPTLGAEGFGAQTSPRILRLRALFAHLTEICEAPTDAFTDADLNAVCETTSAIKSGPHQYGAGRTSSSVRSSLNIGSATKRPRAQTLSPPVGSCLRCWRIARPPETPTARPDLSGRA